ncbi:solute carrier family 25 member 51-like [Limulus polyphemus]|uniref:Solute carrier family 25 member 51-like n=1 Tax=Limulus polyphemus TaxID=6850 RepID=A0ABM1T0X5_LIMPO|nr:solute carrier family 25 member 51-like [Limulus polyphemus]XP_022249526.1 solute carrier family 25 member 51-like [Limulus polyphemus]XP_022249531.1 solute carrier family 25 member 51-like [Limulus polyphemus]
MTAATQTHVATDLHRHKLSIFRSLQLSGKHQDDFKEFLCGWGAAFINISLTFPINKVIFRQMLDGIHLHAAVQQLKLDGLYYLYRGYFPPLIQKTVSVSVMFGTYNEYSQYIRNSFPSVPSLLSLSISAILAGSTEALLMPFERIQTLLQDRQYHHRFHNTFHAMWELRRFGVKEYFRGLTPILIRNGSSNVLFFGFRGKIKEYLPPSHTCFGHTFQDFISGAVIGALISTLFYPVNVIKAKMQVQCGTRFLSFSEAFALTYYERNCNIQKLFCGVHINYTRAFLSWGIINSSYERLKTLLY